MGFRANCKNKLRKKTPLGGVLILMKKSRYANAKMAIGFHKSYLVTIFLFSFLFLLQGNIFPLLTFYVIQYMHMLAMVEWRILSWLCMPFRCGDFNVIFELWMGFEVVRLGVADEERGEWNWAKFGHVRFRVFQSRKSQMCSSLVRLLSELLHDQPWKIRFFSYWWMHPYCRKVLKPLCC